MFSAHNDKERYGEFCSQHPDICLFSSPWWLDATAGAGNWDVILVEDRNSDVIASFPYMLTKGRFGKKMLCMPPLTQKLGPYIVYASAKTQSLYKKEMYEHEVYKAIIEALPKVMLFSVNFDFMYKNWLEFYWADFKQTTRYTYRIYNIKDHASVFEAFSSNRKNKIRKARNLYISDDMTPQAFYDYFEQAMTERKQKVSYSRKVFMALYAAVKEREQGQILCCKDTQKAVHAICLLVWDKSTAYHLIATRQRAYYTSGGSELLIYEAIKYASRYVDVFDFEGSMIKGEAERNASFCALQTEYYNISKDNRLLIPVLRDIKNILRAEKNKLFR